MTLAERSERATFLAVCVGMTAFFVADDATPLALVAIALAAIGRSMARDRERLRRAGAREGHPLPRWLLNTMVLGAVAYAVLAAVRDPEDFVSAIGTLLCALQVIRRFDRPTIRDQRQALVMSLFTAVASALTSNSLELGLLLALYAPIIVRAIALNLLAEGVERAAPPGGPGAPPMTRDAGRDLRRIVVASTLSAGALATAVFVALPRNLGTDLFGDWSSPAVGAQTVGFTEKVQLGRSGELGESQEPVLELLVTDESGRGLGGPDRPVLLRGLVFDEYDASSRAWVRSARPSESRRTVTAPAGGLPVPITQRHGREALVQRITIRNKQSDYLFCAGRPVALVADRETQVIVDNADNVLIAPGRSGRFTYTVESQADYTRNISQRASSRHPPIFRAGRVADLARSIIAEAGYERDPEAWFGPDDPAIARVLERRLRTQYEYTLEMTPPQEAEDPIEMFLFRTRRGHCEYFASAMAALCRALGIDARVVGGYRASDFNELTGQYGVRQSDAHSWVEAQVAPGLWMTFDPSPPDGVNAVARRPGGVVGATRKVYAAAEQAWITWIVGFDRDARAAILGGALGGATTTPAAPSWLMQISPTQALLRVVKACAVGALAFAGAAAAMHALAALWRAARRRLARRAALAGLAPEAAAFERARDAQAEFYRRLLARLESLGAPKPRWRSPIDHADALPEALWALRGDVRALASLYYRLAFARVLLTEEELAGARSRLDAIDRAAKRLGPMRAPPARAG